VAHLLLSQNNLGDKGLEKLANAIANSKTLIRVDLSQNAFTPRSAYSIAEILSQNESIIDLNLGSIQGSQRNRMGKDGGLAIAYGLSLKSCLVQFLNLRSVTLQNDEAEVLAESLEDYLHLLHLDLSYNRIEGARGGTAIARIIMRRVVSRGGMQLQNLNLAHNKLGNSGFAAIVHVLLHPQSFLGRLNVSYNEISDVKLLSHADSLYEYIF
jgi:Ran GTPase-activating protein (RanGAP) involved in mRNA processing and transport